MYNNREYKLVNMAGSTTTQVATGKGTLHAITVNRGVNGATITIVDATSGLTPTMGTITLADSACVTLFYDAVFATGLRIQATASPDITITYTQ